MSLRHDRRRRFLGDDSLSAEPNDDVDGSPGASDGPPTELGKRAYSDAARGALTRPISDFIPSRWGPIGLIAAVAVAWIGAIELAHLWSGRLAGLPGAGEPVAFDLAAPSNVSHWFAAMLLAAAGLVAALNYSLRRHRVDDYHGRYRVWIWVAIACLLASLGETTSVTALGAGICRRIAAWCGASEAIVWPAASGSILALVALRLLIEVWRCRAAVALLLTGVLGFLTAAAVNHDWLIHVSPTSQPLVERGTWLAGYVMTLTVFLVYARHLMLEIEGRIAVVPAKSKPRKIKKSKPREVDEVRSDAPRKPAAKVRTDLDSHSSSQSDAPAPQVRAPHFQSSSGPSSSAASTSGGGAQSQRSLSRAERRRLRREARMES